jgi:hypothetical protein
MRTFEHQIVGSWTAQSQEIERLPRQPWEDNRTLRRPETSVEGIYVLRRRYLRPEHEVEVTFRRLADDWEAATMLIASPRAAVGHESYLKIIGLGLQCVPMLLRRLAETRRNYFSALGAITHAQPAEGITTVPEAVEAWQQWGRDNGYLDD